jgi:hypothetical protein
MQPAASPSDHPVTRTASFEVLFRLLPLLSGLVILVMSAVVHGVLTHRWQPGMELQQAVDRLQQLPDTFGDWIGEPFEQDAQSLAFAGAIGNYSRRFTNQQTGDQVMVSLLVGRSQRMVVHRPEHCYTAVGYQLIGSPVRFEMQPPGKASGELFTAIFQRDETHGPSRLRIFWAFGSSDGWKAPDNPRLAYAGVPVLYKLYVVRPVAVNSSEVRADPCVGLLNELLPALSRTLFAEQTSRDEKS